MKKYLITGGAGFIGSHLSEAFLRLGHRVVVIDNFSTSVFKAGSKIKTYKTDVSNSNKVKRIFNNEKPDFVFHLAGAINMRRPVTDPLFLRGINILERTKIILDACRDYRIKKLIFVSSGGAVYENATVVPTPEVYPASPNSLYGLANLVIEKYIELYCKNYNLNFAIPRMSNVYGPRQWETGVIPSMIIKILKKEPPVIYGKGSQTRDFIYIDDAVKALVVLAEKGKNEVYNVGTGKETSLNEILGLIKDFFDVEIRAIYINSMVDQTERSALDCSKINKEFGWQPQINIKEGLAKTIEWLQKK